MQLTGNDLTIQSLKQALKSQTEFTIAPDALNKMLESRDSVERIIEEGRTVYGINTGFGSFCNVKIDKLQTKQLQQNLIRSHATGLGTPLEDDIVKLMLILRANALIKGFSGVRVSLVERLLLFVNEDIYPIVPSQGSLGASGDLVQLAHIALALIGEGDVKYKGEVMSSKTLHQLLGLTPIVLEAKEGLGLINGTQAMTAIGVKAIIEIDRLIEASYDSSALSFQALKGIEDVFDLEPHLVRGFPNQVEAARRMKDKLTGSLLTTTQGEERVQDAYSLRCIPQVMGAILSSIEYGRTQIEIELNAATDNPLIFNRGKKVISGGNFHGEPIAFAMDFLKLAIAELANLTERRIERLLNPALNNGLPPFLSNHPGIETGAMILQYTAASLVSENKVLAHPASVDSIPSSGNQEDHVSMGTIAARQAYEMLLNTEKVLAIECFVAAQAIHFLDKSKLSSTSLAFYEAYRDKVDAYEQDRIFSVDIEHTILFLREWYQ